ncbi:MAG: acyl-CoA thioesterase [Bacteroidota bacterium]
MEFYKEPLNIRWADIDANRHLRHSVYYDFAAAMRMNYLNSHGLTTEKLVELQVGPILFREEAVFKREVRLEDKVEIDFTILRALPDYSRWSLKHNITKPDGTVCTIITVDGAWMDLIKRKLTVPNEFIQSLFGNIPKANDFEWLTPKQK